MIVAGWKQKLAQEKFGEVWVRTEPAGFTYEPHTHPVDTVYIVISGSMVTHTEGVAREVRPGDRWDVPKHAVHDSTIGPEGCTYLTGIKI